MANIVEGGMRLVGGYMASKNAAERAKRDKAERMALLEGTNFEPAYASDRAPTFQKSQSPVARAYLESFLMGDNPDATFSGAPNAGMVKGQQQARQNAMYGTPQDRAALSQKIQTDTPWKLQPASETMPEINPRDQQVKARYPGLAATGVSAEQADRLKSALGEGVYDTWMSKGLKPEGVELFKNTVGRKLDGNASDEEINAAFNDYTDRGLNGGKKKKSKGPVRDFFRGFNGRG